MYSNKLSPKLYYSLFVLISIYVYFILFNLDSLTHRIYEIRIYCDAFIPTPYLEMSLGIYSFILLTITTILLFQRYLKLWLIKAFMTFFILILHENMKGLDAYLYYADVVCHLDDIPFASATTINIVYFNHYLTYIFGESYFSLKLVNSYIGFLALIIFYQSYLYINGDKKKDNFIFILFLFPTIIFWSSILGKDPINLLAVGLFIYGSLQFIDKITVKSILLILLAMYIAVLVRPWYPLIMVISLGLFHVKLNSIKSIFLFIFLSVPIYQLFFYMLALRGISSFDLVFEAMTATSKGFQIGNSSVDVFEIKGPLDYIKYFIPNTYTALFRPLPFEARSAIMMLSAIENVMLIYMFFKYVVFNIKIIFSNKYFKFLFLFIFSWLLLYTIISAGNLGAAARFKLQVLPIMLILFYSIRNYVNQGKYSE